MAIRLTIRLFPVRLADWPLVLLAVAVRGSPMQGRADRLSALLELSR